MDPKKGMRKWCIVPGCESTSSKYPEKLFFIVPRDEKRRNAWINAVRRNPANLSKTSSVYVCEDHFNIEEDMENYVKFRLIGGQKKIKLHVVPHIFACQADRKRAAPKSPRKAAVKRARKQLINEMMENHNDTTATLPSTYQYRYSH